jgi:hypothetical protein
MQFDPDNRVVKLCAHGMEMEGLGKYPEAKELFLQAWNSALSDFERFIAAHYVARQMSAIQDKLQWNEIALHSALQVNDAGMKSFFPSLYLNIGKCNEDLKDFDGAEKNYLLAFSFTDYLDDDGYGRMIKSGIKNGLARLSKDRQFSE